MRRIGSATLLLIYLALAACDPPKTDAEQIVGLWDCNDHYVFKFLGFFPEGRAFFYNQTRGNLYYLPYSYRLEERRLTLQQEDDADETVTLRIESLENDSVQFTWDEGEDSESVTCAIRREPTRELEWEGGMLTLSLKVLILNDPRFEAISREDADISLAAARKTLRSHYPGTDVRFTVDGPQSMATAFETREDQEHETDWYLFIHENQQKYLEENRARWSRNEEYIQAFLKRYPIADIRNLLDEDDRRRIDRAPDPYSTASSILREIYLKKVRSYFSTPHPSGKGGLLEDRSWNYHRHWGRFLASQNQYDIVLYNGIVLMDSLAAPYPHPIMHRAKISGAAHTALYRRGLDRRGLFASYFEIFEGARIPGFNRIDPNLPRARRAEILGTVLIAHEIAHNYFALPDFYDHPDYCLLNSSPRTVEYMAHFESIRKHPGPCPVCRPLVSARKKILRGLVQFNRGEFRAAAANLRRPDQKLDRRLGEDLILRFAAPHAYFRTVARLRSGENPFEIDLE